MFFAVTYMVPTSADDFFVTDPVTQAALSALYFGFNHSAWTAGSRV